MQSRNGSDGTGYARRVTRAQPPNPTLALLALPEFRALLTARGLAALGMSAIATVVAFQTYEVTGEPLALGLLGLVEAIPALALMLLGGHVADRRDRRSIILITGSLLAAGTLALALMSLDPAGISFLGILAVVFLIGVASGFERPALVAFEAQVIPIEHASRGASLSGATWTGAAIIGPAAGGLAIAIFGIPATYLALTMLIAISVLAITRIGRKPMPEPDRSESIVHSLAGGVRYVVANQVLLGSMALDLFAVFFGGAIALLPIFAADILGVGPLGLGLLRTAPSVGALLSMLATTRIPPRQHAGRLLLGFVAVFGVSMIAFGLSTSFVLSLAALFVAGLADGVSVVIRLVILRVESPEDPAWSHRLGEPPLHRCFQRVGCLRERRCGDLDRGRAQRSRRGRADPAGGGRGGRAGARTASAGPGPAAGRGPRRPTLGRSVGRLQYRGSRGRPWTGPGTRRGRAISRR